MRRSKTFSRAWTCDIAERSTAREHRLLSIVYRFATRHVVSIRMRGAAFAAAVLAAAAMEVDTSSAVNTRTGLRKSGLHDPIGSVQGLITRRLGAAYVPSFQLQVIPAAPNGEDVFQLDFNQATKQVIVRGSAGYAMAAGLNWYLKYTANVSFSWGRNDSGNQVKLPEPGTLTPPANPGQTIAPVKYRYSYNVCTYGYSMPWWNFTQFEEEIDRLALWGVNLPLAFQGQVSVWFVVEGADSFVCPVVCETPTARGRDVASVAARAND